MMNASGEKRLSPRRASKLSLLPHSPRHTQVRLKPLLNFPPFPPKGGTPTSETPRYFSVPEYSSFDARPPAGSFRLRRISS